MAKIINPIERFAEKFQVANLNQCWSWHGAIGARGTGANVQFLGKTWRAPRLMYFLEHGEIPKGKLICHTCDNTLCVNPNHLYAGTHKQNSLDMMNRGRSVKGRLRPFYRGTRNPNACLSDLEREAVRKMRNEDWSIRAISNQFGCSQSTVKRVTRSEN